MKIFDLLKPMSGKAAARRRERELADKLEKLMETNDEETFRKGLEQEFGITPDHPNYQGIMDVWRNAE